MCVLFQTPEIANDSAAGIEQTFHLKMLSNFDSTTGEQVFEQFQALIVKEQYGEIAKLGGGMTDEEFLKHICLIMTTLEHCNGLFEYLQCRGMIPGLLMHGNMELVRKAIIELKGSYFLDYCISRDHLQDAIILSFNNYRYDRAINLLEAVQGRFAIEDEKCKRTRKPSELEIFMDLFFTKLAPEKDTAQFLHFLNLRGEIFSKEYPSIFAIFCLVLVCRLQKGLDDPNSQKLLLDLTAQPSLLTPKVFVKAFISPYRDYYKKDFVTYAWREAVAEALEEESRYGDGYGRMDGVWKHMMNTFPGEFPEAYPPSDEVNAAVLARFKTKRQLEEAWTKQNASKLLEKVEEPVTGISPTFSLNLVPEYAITWITFVPNSLRKQLTPEASEKVSEQLKILIDGEEYTEIARIGNNMKEADFFKYLCPMITTLDHCKSLFAYLKRCDMFADFFAYGNMELAKKVIAEFKDGSNYHISCDHTIKAIIVTLNEDQHDRVIDFLKAVQERCIGEDEKREQLWERTLFEGFVRKFFNQLVPQKNSTPLKRFLTLRREELNTQHPIIFETICQELVSYLKYSFDDPNAKKLLIDFIGQPSLLTPKTFAKGFLPSIPDFDSDDSDAYDDEGAHVGDGHDYTAEYEYYFNSDDSDTDCYDVPFRVKFIIYGWREAVEEALKGDYQGSSRWLWRQIIETFPEAFPEKFPPSNETLAIVSKKFKTKQEIEKEWAEDHAPQILE